MEHQKILIRPDDSKVKIFVTVWVPGPFENGKPIWNHGVVYCPYGKRKFKHDSDMFGNLATKEEILMVKMELWEKIKPF